MSIFIIAEAGINHNGDIEIAKNLISAAASCGADAIKFQKRTLDVVYTREQLDAPRESPWGNTQRAQKAGLEFGLEAFQEIDRHCREVGIEWFASAWDVEAQRFLQQFDFRHNKVASAMLTHEPFLNMVAEEKKPTFISTGMSTLEEIANVVQLFRKKDCPFELMHCNSTYPMPENEANLRVMGTLRKLFNCPVGYSGHEVGLTISVAAAALGASSIERHITLDRAMYGSDQAASVEVVGFVRLVRMIRAVEMAMGDGVKKFTDQERSSRAKLAPWSLDHSVDHPNNPFRA
ncbi:MAG: N-acetylneuraminate synthase family protein [Magnetococcales bacterium]|nr:N-acetylneuraminate synthase family protein [Magnetococcales bacterium]